MVKEIQYRTGKSIDEIAKSIDYARAYFNDQINKGENINIKKKLIAKYKSSLEHFVRNEDYGNQTEVQEYPGAFGQKTPELLTVLVELMKRQNHILERQLENVELKVERIDTNLDDALGRVESLKLDLISGRIVVLKSLARLEKKNPDTLLKEADNTKLELLKAQTRQSKSAGKGK
jgi:hypothetical protein